MIVHILITMNIIMKINRWNFPVDTLLISCLLKPCHVVDAAQSSSVHLAALTLSDSTSFWGFVVPSPAKQSISLFSFSPDVQRACRRSPWQNRTLIHDFQPDSSFMDDLVLGLLHRKQPHAELLISGQLP